MATQNTQPLPTPSRKIRTIAMRKLFVLASFVLLPFSTSFAQDLDETLSEVGSAYARAYVEPLAKSIGTNFNSGLIHPTRSSGVFDLNVSVGVKAFATFLNADAQTFDLTYSGTTTIDYNYQGQQYELEVPGVITVSNAPTVFGASEEGMAVMEIDTMVTIQYNGTPHEVAVDTTVMFETVGGLVQTDIAPLAVPQASIGTVLGTDLMVRWLPQINIPDVGNLEVLGLGLRHNVSQYLPMLPVDVSVMAAWQGISFDDEDGGQIMEARMSAYNITAGRRFGPLALYGGYQIEQSNVEVAYTFEQEVGNDIEEIPISFNVEGTNRHRGLAGLALFAGPLHLTADASIGEEFMLSTGIGFGF
jgi:hypothetical protein